MSSEENHDTPSSSTEDPSQLSTVPPTNRPFAPSEFLTHLPSSTSIPADDGSPAVSAGAAAPSPLDGLLKLRVDSQGRTLNPRSCVTCRKRKVKCDKTHPCANCNRAHIECIFPSPGRAPRKARKLGDGRDKELLDRLRRLEGVVKGLGVEVPGEGEAAVAGERRESQAGKDADMQNDNGGQAQAEDGGNHTMQVATPDQDHVFARSPHDDVDPRPRHRTLSAEVKEQARFEHRFGRLVVNEGKSRYVNNSFWASLSNEVEDLKGILNQSSDEEEEYGASPSTNSGVSIHQGWLFGFSSQSVDMLSLHPLPGQIELYWEAYKDRVDPLVKVLHIPTVERSILSAVSHLSNLPKAFEALLFSIYYGAVTALSAQDCLSKLGEEKTVLLSRYRFAVEQSLARANFLTTEEMIVLQAFVIFLICLRRNNEARVIWTLTGLVVRIAQTIGIHRDGSHFALRPFEVEMRRRLWWQVCILDTRASEDHGCDPTITEQSFDTKMPLNVNDVDIHPDMTEYPAEQRGCTDMSFCLIRFEVANTFRRINYIPPGPTRACKDFFSSVTLEDKEKWITESHQRLEDRYLRHCDMSVPLFWVTATVARLMMSKMWLMVYHPYQRQDGGASLPSETRDKLFITSLENIEYSILLETEARTMKWGWLFRTYRQWHAFAFILSELCHRTTGDLVDRAWVAVDKARDGRWGPSVTEASSAGHLWRPLKRLLRKAKDARQRGLAEEQLQLATAAVGRPPNAVPARRYSPNALAGFNNAARPRMTRAPLSQAQVQRFTDGPTFGQVPIDKHELLKSPKPDEASVGQQPNTTAPEYNLLQTMVPPTVGQTLLNVPVGVNDYPQQPYTAGFAQDVPSGTEDVGFGFPSNNSHNTTAYNNFFPSGNSDQPSAIPDGDGMLANPVDVNSFDGNDLSMTDSNSVVGPSGELNWENWDELVRQFGMDIDQGAEPLGGAAMWEMGTPGANLRREMGGDWF